MQINFSKLARKPNCSFAGAWLVFWSFGLFHSPHQKSANAAHHLDQMPPSQIRQNSNQSWYVTPLSPGFSDLGS
jgi:hypothetical protein